MKVLKFAADADDVTEAIARGAEAEALDLLHQDLQLQYHRQQLQKLGQRHMTFPTLAFYRKQFLTLQQRCQRLQLLRLRRLLRL